MKAFIVFCLLLLSVLCPAQLRADLNGDCKVDLADLAILLSEWMQKDEDCMALGDELVVNGGFDTEIDDEWQKVGSVDSSGGSCLLSKTTGVSLIQQESVEAAKTYFVSIDVLEVVLTNEATANLTLGGSGTGISLNAVQTFTETITTGGSTNVTISLSSTTNGDKIRIDNVSVREVLPDGGMSGAEYMQAIMDDER
jgi:hypothetical protein